MNGTERLESLRRLLFERWGPKLYAVLDGASIPGLLSLLRKHQIVHVCLIRGELDPELAQTAPYLVQLPKDSEFTKLLLTQGLGNHWGILALSHNDFRTLRMHLRKFLTVWDPDGKPLFFRYYDPRVLRVYLPTCNTNELRIVFGPVSAYFTEADTNQAILRFTFSGRTLAREHLTLPHNQPPSMEA